MDAFFRKVRQFATRLEPEALIWSGALIYLAVTTHTDGQHFSLCWFRFFGFEHCPGCGLGHSISYLLHGEFLASLQAHWLGPAAVLLLIARIVTLTSRSRAALISDYK